MSNTTELVFIPTPSMGHLVSAVELSKRMLATNPDISIFIHIINFPHQAAKINAYVDSKSRDNPYPTRLEFITLPSPSNPPATTSPSFFATNIQLHEPLVKQVVEDRIRMGIPKPAGFVIDMFCSSMVDIANELDIPSYIFFTSGANLLNLMCHTQSLSDDQGFDIPSKYSESDFSTVVPGFKNPVTSKVIPMMFQDKNRIDMYLSNARKFRETKGILINTYEELESCGVQALLDIATHHEIIPTIYPVGPIFELDNKSRGNGYQDEESDSIMKWLDGQPESSVVFLCFGSMGSFDEEQIKEIANGLDQSGHRFIWSLRRPLQLGGPTNENAIYTEALPEGFLERTASRGKVIGWAPQVEVLAHSAVGGFVSHCGWNSTLESLWFGVPMAMFPLYAEQQLNAFTLVKELGLAVEIRMDYKKDWKATKGNMIVTAEEIKNGVNKLMNMDEQMRNKVKEMSDFGRKALEEGGSSYDSLGKFIHDVLSYAA